MPSPPFACLAQCAPGLEPILARELGALGIRGTEVRGGVEWRGGWGPLLRANLELRVASRVLATIRGFRARALGELERKAAGVPWDDWLPPGPVRFRVSASRSRLNHGRAIAERLHGASGRTPPPGADEGSRAGEGHDRPPSAPATGEGAEREEGATLVLVRIFRDEVTIRLDASGEHLHRRGYRIHAGEAPLRETLAAAVLLATGWTGSLPLVDPFCGSGTVPLEAALLARRIAPGLARSDRAARPFAVQRWPGFPRAVWTEVVQAARDRILPEAPAPILGSDRSPAVVEAALENRGRAGLLGDVDIRVAPATRSPLPPEAGWIVTNPPYGIRLGERRRLRRLYAALGRVLRGAWASWGVGLLSGDPVLAGHLGLRFEEAFRARHGGREVRLLVRRPNSGS